MRINNNMAAMNSWRNLSTSGANLAKSLERLSSGNRINRASDDAAGLAVSEKMSAQIRGINMATRNAQDGISLVQTAEGAAGQIGNMLQRMRELAVQAKTGTLGTEDRDLLNKEYAKLSEEISRTATGTKFNGQSLLANAATGTAVFTPDSAGVGAGISVTVTDPTKVAVNASYDLTYDLATHTITINDGTNDIATIDRDANKTFSVNGVTIDATQFDFSSADGVQGAIAVTAYGAGSNTFKIQVGPNSGDEIAVKLDNLDISALGIDSTDIKTDTNAGNAITKLDNALKTVNSARAAMGASQNQLENAVTTLQTQSENLTAAQSRIKDVDMAAEMSQFTKFQVLQQAGTAMLAQANQLPQGVMSLLRG